MREQKIERKRGVWVFPYCKRRKAGRDLGTRLESLYSYLCVTFNVKGSTFPAHAKNVLLHMSKTDQCLIASDNV